MILFLVDGALSLKGRRKAINGEENNGRVTAQLVTRKGMEKRKDNMGPGQT